MTIRKLRSIYGRFYLQVEGEDQEVTLDQQSPLYRKLTLRPFWNAEFIIRTRVNNNVLFPMEFFKLISHGRMLLFEKM